MQREVVVVAGGTGLVGQHLLPMLRAKGYEVRTLTRHVHHADQYAWNPNKGTIDERALDGCTAVINLAGAGIADRRWTEARKRELIDSRVQSANTLANAFLRLHYWPKVYVSASAIGYYGNTGEKWLTETDLPAQPYAFMVQCCQAWEQAAREVGDASGGMRTVVLRIGIVLDKNGGALREVAKPLYARVGSYFGDGQAWWSWIHHDDLCRMFVWALEQPSVIGIYNAVAPYPVRNYDLVKATAVAMGHKALLVPVPAFGLRLALGELSAVVLNSNRVRAEKIQRTGFTFVYEDIQAALTDIFSA